MFKEFLANGRLSLEEQLALRDALNFDEPDYSYSSSILISFLPKKGVFNLSDRHGFLCSVFSLDHLVVLLAIAREESLREYFSSTLGVEEAAPQHLLDRTRPPGLAPVDVHAPTPSLSPAQVRARQLAEDMQARRGLAPIAGSPSDVEVLRETSENDEGFSPIQANDYLNLDGTQE